MVKCLSLAWFMNIKRAMRIPDTATIPKTDAVLEPKKNISSI
jgi:hypothetical protein